MSPVDSPDVLQHDAPDYKKWSAQPHSAESVARS
jgi:tRNA threonylcarbamoyladenosine biosynthesis protein TsaB